MANIKTFQDIINDEDYNKLIDIIKEKNRFISQKGILKKRFGKYEVSNSEESNTRKKLNRLVKEQILITKTKKELIRDLGLRENAIFSRKELMKFCVVDYTKRKQRYYFYPKHTNYVVIRLKKMCSDIEKHHFVSDEDLEQVKEKITHFSSRFSCIDMAYNIAKYNIEDQKLLEDKKIGPIISRDIKISSNNEASARLLNKLVNSDIAIRYICYMNDMNKETMNKSMNDIAELFQILQKYYNDQYLATKYFS